jgi:O-acetyl-ADP-ribose deacetylase
LHSLEAILEEATRISAKASEGGAVLTPRGDPCLPGVAVKFPGDQVVAFDRVSMLLDGDHVRLAMWPAELKAQYTRVYSDTTKVEALIDLGNRAGWTLESNFQLAHRFAQPPQRWYPGRHLPGPLYVNQWMDDFRLGCAGGRTRDEVADPRFFDWLVERSYACDSERGSLKDWLNSKPSGIQVHIRPGIQVRRSWPYADAFEQDRKREVVAEVREAIDRVLSALDEPKLNVIVIAMHTPSADRPQ